MKNVLITFDVDGTLTKSGKTSNRLHKRAFEYAFEKVFGVWHSGGCSASCKTDQMIILDCLEYYGIPRAVAEPRLKEVMDKMVELCEENRRDVKQASKEFDAKLEHYKVKSRRPDIEIVGMCSFGSDHTDRGELVNLATRRATKCFPGGFRLRAHIGDTPADIQAAHHAQALAIGVCTGAFSRCELEHAGASLKRNSAEGQVGIDIPHCSS